MIAIYQTSASFFLMSNRHRKMLAALLADPANGNLEYSLADLGFKAAVEAQGMATLQ